MIYTLSVFLAILYEINAHHIIIPYYYITPFERLRRANPCMDGTCLHWREPFPCNASRIQFCALMCHKPFLQNSELFCLDQRDADEDLPSERFPFERIVGA